MRHRRGAARPTVRVCCGRLPRLASAWTRRQTNPVRQRCEMSSRTDVCRGRRGSAEGAGGRGGGGGGRVLERDGTTASDVEEAGKEEREAEYARHLQRAGRCSLPSQATLSRRREPDQIGLPGMHGNHRNHTCRAALRRANHACMSALRCRNVDSMRYLMNRRKACSCCCGNADSLQRSAAQPHTAAPAVLRM